jgi:hypothetical protein
MPKIDSPPANASRSVARIPLLVQQLYSLVAELQDAFPGRRFTPDGHLLGSIGEVFASHFYKLNLLRGSFERHDAISEDGRAVQIKATQGDRVALRSEPDYLLVLKLSRNGTFEEIYNGPGALPWKTCCNRRGSNGQHQISIATLRKLMQNVPPGGQLPRGA